MANTKIPWESINNSGGTFGTGLSWRDARYLEVIGNIHEKERQGE